MSVFKATDSGLRCAEVFPNRMSLNNLSHDMSPDGTHRDRWLFRGTAEEYFEHQSHQIGVVQEVH